MAESALVSRRTGSVQGVSGGVEKILKALRQKSERLNASPILEKLQEEEEGDSEKGKRGKVVLYTTSVQAVRRTHEQCKQVVHILKSHKILFITKNVFLHPDYSRELAERLGGGKNVALPQLFAGGEHIGNGETVIEMNEMGELEELLVDYKSDHSLVECKTCGDQGFVLCLWCGGSKKGVKNAFGDLKCTVCNKNGLQMCPECRFLT